MDAILSAGLQPGRALSCGNLTEAVGNKKLIAAELDTTPQAIAIGKQPAAREFVERRSSSTQLLGHTLPPHDSLSNTARMHRIQNHEANTGKEQRQRF